MKYCVLFPLFVLLFGCATKDGGESYEQRYVDNLVSVPHGANWSLIGEWDRPGSDGWLNFTRSIILLNGKYIEVSSGRVVTGCCYWPQGIRLEKLAEQKFLNPVSGATYTIDPSGALIISDKDGSISTLNKTAPEYSLSRGWSGVKE